MRARRQPSLTLRSTLAFAVVAMLAVASAGMYLYKTMKASVMTRSDHAVLARLDHFRKLLQYDLTLDTLRSSPQLFENMLDSLRETVTKQLAHVRPLSEEEQRQMLAQIAAQQADLQKNVQAQHPGTSDTQAAEGEAATDGFVEDDPSTWGNPGRNEKCPCGSGKKFKHCHGRLA